MNLNVEALKAFREMSGDTQETLAARAGLSEHGLHLIERGKNTPRPSTIRKLANALSVPVGALTYPEDERVAS